MALRLEINRLFKKQTHLLHLLYRNNIFNLYDKVQYNSFKIDSKSYVGKGASKESCFILKHLMENKDFKDIKVYKNRIEGKDHYFMKFKDQIIDPTYRQFFINEHILSNNCMYRHILFINLNPFMVHNIEKTDLMVNNLSNAQEFFYNNPFAITEKLKKNWDLNDEVTDQFNLTELVNSEQNDKTQMDYFVNYVRKINNVL